MSIIVSPGQRVPLDARWVHNGQVLTGLASIEFMRWTPAGSQWWSALNDAWQSQPVELPMEFDADSDTHRYNLVVPSLWTDEMVRYICRLPGQVSLLDLLRCDVSVSSRASERSVGGDIGRVQ